MIFDDRLHNFLGFAEIYAKVGQNSILQAKPSVIHFNGFQVGEKITKTLVSVMFYFNVRLMSSTVNVHVIHKQMLNV